MIRPPARPAVLVFAGNDPSGGAGLQADIATIGSLGAHALPVTTVLTVQDNDRVFEIHPVAAALVIRQAEALIEKIPVSAIKIGILGDAENAAAVAGLVRRLRVSNPRLPVVLDPVLASGHGDALGRGRPAAWLAPLLSLATLVTPNLPEAGVLCPGAAGVREQGAMLTAMGCAHVLIKGGHATHDGDSVINAWYDATRPDACAHEWRWRRLPGEFHGSGCTLAAACAALLAHGLEMRPALALAQDYCQHALENAYAITGGQLVPNRFCLCDPARPGKKFDEEKQ